MLRGGKAWGLGCDFYKGCSRTYPRFFFPEIRTSFERSGSWEDPNGLSPGEEGDLVHKSVILDDARADHILSRDHASQAAAVLPIDDSGIELAVKTASDLVSEETGHFGNKVGDSLVVDGPSSTHEASMPGSNESPW